MDQFAREVGMLGLPSLVVAGRPRSCLVRLTSWDKAAVTGLRTSEVRQGRGPVAL
jgi:hypothetical protein